ncbi:FGGY family carbohydrate kinase [Nocardiopsis sp. NPDC055824]
MSGGRTLLGVDAGTSVVKAVVFDETGAALAVRGRGLAVAHGPGGAVEQDLEHVLAGVAEVVRAVAAEVGAPPDLVAVTGQGDGCWLTDADHRQVRPAMSWLDGRASEILRRWNSTGVTERVYRENGTTMFPGTAAPLLAWLDEHEPGSLDRAATAGYCKDAVFARLTGRRVTDASDSSMPFGDGSGKGYSDTVLELTGLSGRRGLLAPVSAAPRAGLHADGARLLGLPEGTPVSSGPFDFPACAVGAGVRDPGDALMIVGTTLGCMVLVDRLETAGTPAGFHVSTGERGRWLRAMPAMVGTASVDWLLSVLGMDVEGVGRSLAESAPGAGGVEVLPYLATSGERAPFVDPRAAGQFTGVRLTTSRGDLVRAVCEGLAYAARHCFDTAGSPDRLLVCGGGSRSLPWLQVFADVLGIPLETARAPEVGARGAVLSAVGDSVDRAGWTFPSATVEPDPALRAHYDDGYGRYLAHLEAARPLWRPLAAGPAPGRVPRPSPAGDDAEVTRGL